MNVLSLFDGISCGQIALECAGIDYKNYYASEINEYAIRVAMSNYPNTIQLGDVRNIHFTKLGIEVDKSPGSMRVIETDIDLLIGGSPCQGFSFAGKGLNFEDPRSKLFFEFVRLKNEIKPNYFLLENVVMKKEYQKIISDLLGVEPVLINSSLVSAQSRQRLYWTNIPNITQPEDREILLNDIIRGEYYADRNKSYCIDANYGKGTNFRRYYFCGSRQLVLESGYRPRILSKDTANLTMHGDGNKWRKLTTTECERLQTIPVGYTSSIPYTHQYEVIGNAWTVDVIAHIFSFIPKDLWQNH
jgi:site-specific DNA-cytosine methylase